MKITRLRSSVIALPTDEPISGAPEIPDGKRIVVVCEMETDQGIVGLGMTILAHLMSPTVKTALDQFGEAIIGMDPMRIEAITAKVRDLGANAGPGGVVQLALSAIDIALWDIKGKALNQPVWKLLGSGRDSVPCYASGALMRGHSLDHCAKASRTLVEKGFREAKMQLALPGKTSPDLEVERARLVRESLGRDIRLMCDINQRWRVDQAIAIGRRLEEFEMAWLEDVTTADDFAGLARVTDALATPVAGGEYLYGLTPHRHMLEARSVDILMVDPFRAGGISGWMRAAALAEAFNLPIVSHLAPEIQLHCVAAAPNGLTVEYMAWTRRLWEEMPWPKDGALLMPSAPGLGLAFDQAALKKFAA